MNQMYKKVVYRSPKLEGANIINLDDFVLEEISRDTDVKRPLQKELIDHYEAIKLFPVNGQVRPNKRILDYHRNRFNDLLDEEIIEQHRLILKIEEQFYGTEDPWKKNAFSTNYVQALFAIYKMFMDRGRWDDGQKIQNSLNEFGYEIFYEDDSYDLRIRHN